MKSYRDAVFVGLLGMFSLAGCGDKDCDDRGTDACVGTVDQDDLMSWDQQYPDAPAGAVELGTLPNGHYVMTRLRTVVSTTGAGATDVPFAASYRFTNPGVFDERKDRTRVRAGWAKGANNSQNSSQDPMLEVSLPLEMNLRDGQVEFSKTQDFWSQARRAQQNQLSTGVRQGTDRAPHFYKVFTAGRHTDSSHLYSWKSNVVESKGWAFPDRNGLRLLVNYTLTKNGRRTNKVIEYTYVRR